MSYLETAEGLLNSDKLMVAFFIKKNMGQKAFRDQ